MARNGHKIAIYQCYSFLLRLLEQKIKTNAPSRWTNSTIYTFFIFQTIVSQPFIFQLIAPFKANFTEI